MMEYDNCYVFEPEESRPSKKRKTGPQGLQDSWQLRRRAYDRAWRAQQARIDTVLEGIHASTLSEVSTFLDGAIGDDTGARIPTGIILTSPGPASQNSLASKLAHTINSHKRRVQASLDSASAPNLKAALKTIIQKSTSAANVDDDDEEGMTMATRKGRRLLNYDLQILHDFIRDRKVEQVVVVLQDTEALSSELLSELIELMSSWQDRIPFVCLFNIATSVDFLQERLSGAAIRCLDGKLFDAAPSTAETQLVFSTFVDKATELWIGPELLASALERQSDYVQSIDSFVDMIQYAYMSCFYANALSIFLSDGPESAREPDLLSDHYEALRSLDSFRAYAQSLLDSGDLIEVRSLLESDSALLSEAKRLIRDGRSALTKLNTALDIIRLVQEHLPNTSTTAKTSLYMQAMLDKLRGSALLRSLLLSLRKAPSDSVNTLLTALAEPLGIRDSDKKQVASLIAQLSEIRADNNSAALRSADDIGNSSVRTTVVAQKVHLSKQKSELSKQDAAYTNIVRQLSDLLNNYFEETLIDPKSLPLHEIFIYDLKSPHREVFTPRPRHAIERALAAPHDYLDCECCAPVRDEADEATLSATQPATAVLYQLYLESGTLINVSDLWQAFSVVMGENESEEGLMALFERALAELRHLGMVKSTRKRVDHVAKVAWKGL